MKGDIAMRATITLVVLCLATRFAVAGPQAAAPAPLAPASQAYYVDANVLWGGAVDGSSWENAFFELQPALQLATPGTTIYVAEGYYQADYDAATFSYTGNRAATFQLKNGVTLIGGFPTGGDWYSDPANHKSILNGNIGDWQTDGDNTYNIVTAGAGIDATAVLDGFFLWSARGDGPYPQDRGAGILLFGGSPTLRHVWVQWNRAQLGAGVYNVNGSPSMESMTIAFNEAISGAGGGMWNEGGSPHIVDAFFLQNDAPSEGGGLFTEGGSPFVERSRFVGNAGTRGGGISNWPGSSLRVDNSEFQGNTAIADIGGGIFNWQGLLQLNNVTVSGNTATFGGGGGLYLFDPNTVTIKNSIFWGNNGGTIGGALATVSNSLVQGGYAGTGILNANPLFRDAAQDNLRLATGSPAIGTGSPLTCAAYDQQGYVRDGVCDMGAYEYLGTTGTFWTNGEIDLAMSPWSFDRTPIGGLISESADDFVVPAGMVCDVSSIRGSMFDGTKIVDAVAYVYSDQNMYGAPLGTYAVSAHCGHDAAEGCNASSDCVVPGGCDASCAANGYQCVNNQCLSACVLPGRMFRDFGIGPLWEPRFDGVNLHLGSGRYWTTIVGTLEPDSQQGAFAVTAGTGHGNPFLYRDVGYAWVDGGVYWGSISRDLGLDVDAVCAVDGDGDLSPVGVDCDDANPNRFPGNPEICDHIDNNCDGVADTGVAPTVVPNLTMNRTHLFWNAVPNAVGYDIVSGLLDFLRLTGGDFGTGSCEADDVIGTSYDLGDGYPHGMGIWYIIRAASPCGNTTYDDGSGTHQVQSRDAEIVAGGSQCP